MLILDRDGLVFGLLKEILSDNHPPQLDYPSPIRTLKPTQSQAKTNEMKRWYFGDEAAWDMQLVLVTRTDEPIVS
jgi:hypothetical protein